MTSEPDRPATPETDAAQLQHMVDSVRDYAIFMLNPLGYVASWNRGAERIKGYRPEEIVGKHFSTFYPLVDIRSGKPQYELQVAAEVGRFEDEGWRIRKDGTQFWANVVITAIRNPDNELVGFGKVTRDLTERKRAEDEREILLEAERASRVAAEQARTRIEALQRITEAGLAFVDAESYLTEAGRQISDVFEVEWVVTWLRDGDELVAAASSDPQHPVGTRMTMDRGFAGRVAAEGVSLVIQEERRERTIGPLHDVTWLGVPLALRNETIGVIEVSSDRPTHFGPDDSAVLQMLAGRVALALDRARSLRAERDARLEAIRAEERARMRDEFIAIAAHELKTPLTALSASAQLALRRMVRSDHATAQSLIEQSLAQASRMDRLITDLLEGSRIESGRLTIHREAAELGQIVRDCATASHQTSGRDVRVTAPPQLVADVDPLRFEQVVSNLVDNAVKYSPGDTPVDVELRAHGDDVELIVRDQGEGVPTAERDRLFERFFRGRDEGNRAGLGLGLYITRAIASAHGGEIHAEFPPEGGSRFVVTLPGAGRVHAED